MKGITDIHTHIMFRVDDGSDSMEKSLEMLRQEYNQGVTNVILTPHYHVGGCVPDREIVKNRYMELKEKVHTLIPEMNIYLGNEIMACNDMVEMLDAKKVFTLAESSYVLVEFYPGVQYSAMEKFLSTLLNGGYMPVVAHCERYKCLRSSLKVINYKNMEHLIEMGVYMQVNVTSVFGNDHKFIGKLIQNDFLHLVASDAHSLGVRGIYWDKCIKYLSKKYDEEYIESILVTNPKKILENQYI